MNGLVDDWNEKKPWPGKEVTAAPSNARKCSRISVIFCIVHVQRWREVSENDCFRRLYHVDSLAIFPQRYSRNLKKKKLFISFSFSMMLNTHTRAHPKNLKETQRFLGLLALQCKHTWKMYMHKPDSNLQICTCANGKTALISLGGAVRSLPVAPVILIQRFR